MFTFSCFVVALQALSEKLRSELRAERMHSLRLELWIAALHDEVGARKSRDAMESLSTKYSLVVSWIQQIGKAIDVPSWQIEDVH